jgi:hypothetical protein
MDYKIFFFFGTHYTPTILFSLFPIKVFESINQNLGHPLTKTFFTFSFLRYFGRFRD